MKSPCARSAGCERKTDRGMHKESRPQKMPAWFLWRSIRLLYCSLVFECRSSILMRNSREGYGPVVTERAGAQYPRKHSPWDSACGATGRTQMAPVLGSARAPLDLVPELPHEILVRNNDQGGNPHRRNSDSGRFYWAPWKASLYQPGKPLDPKESNGMRGSGPGGLDWRGHGRPPWDLKDLTADQNRRLSEFYRWGGVNPPRPHGGPEVKLYPDFPES